MKDKCVVGLIRDFTKFYPSHEVGTAIECIDFFCSNLSGQDIPKTFRIYNTWVYSINEPVKRTGALYAVTDSTIVLSFAAKKKDYYSDNYQVSPILIHSIEKIQTRSKGKIYRSAGIGALVGAVIGAAIGFIDGDEKCQSNYSFIPCANPSSYVKAEEKAVVIGGLFIPVGAVIGGLIGMSRTGYTIDGNLETYNNYQTRLRKKSIVKE